MKLYWRDRDGSLPPPNARFVLFPFFRPEKQLSLDALELVRDLPPPTSLIETDHHQFLPSKEDWRHTLSQAIDAMQQDQFQKVVLARCCKMRCSVIPDPFAIAAKLLESNSQATLFCLVQGDEAFIGATPEMLFSREGRIVRSEALAGTVRRGQTAQEDLQLEQELLHSEKLKQEFLPVQTYIEETLSKLCDPPLKRLDLHVRKTPTVQHLCSQFEGTLRNGLSDEDLIRSLHPTPALAGYPLKPARNWIAQTEPFDRKYYGSTFGWQTKDASRFCVAIRCCHLKGKEIQLFTGAGIIPLSQADQEWEELNHKMNLYREIFTLSSEKRES